MRIGIFTDTYPPYINGVSTSVEILKKSLEKKGHQVFVVTVNDENMTYRYEDENMIIRIPGIPIGIYDYRLTGVYPLRAINKIRKWDLDVIHSHTEFGVGTFARVVAKQFNIPLVHTYHTMYEDYVHYITKGYFDKTSRKIVEYLTKFYCDKTASELIVPTLKTYDLFKEKYHFDRNVHIVPTGIEIERFYKENYKASEISALKKSIGIKNNDFVTLFVGRIAKEKSVDVLLETQKELAKKYKNSKLIIIGDGPDKEIFMEMIKEYNLEDSIKLLGKIPYDEIPKYYQLATVFATASLTETQGLTVIEAMAGSIPVVAANDESFNTVVIDDLNGKLFNNKKEYKNILEELIKDPNKVKRMGQQTRINSETFSSKYYALKVLNVYKTAIKNNENNKGIIEKIKATFKKGN